MKLNVWMALSAILYLIAGVALVLMPTTILPGFGISLDAGGTYLARMFGAAFLLLAVLLWTVKNVHSDEAQRDIVLAVFTGDAVGFIIALLSQLSNAVHSLGWGVVAIYLLLTIAFGYFVLHRTIPSTLQVHQRPTGA